MSDTSDTQVDISLPAGWTFQGYQDTTQTAAGNQVIQGIKFLLVGPNNGQTSIFIPKAVLPNTAAVAASITKQINDLQAVLNLANPG